MNVKSMWKEYQFYGTIPEFACGNWRIKHPQSV